MNRKTWHRLYNTWHGMIRRCYKQNSPNYERYGGRGITVCDEWKNSFHTFLDWAINNGFNDGLTIDRINNDLGYSPKNCRWATTKEQTRNYSRNIMITYNGKTQCACDWADEIGIKRATILRRIRLGWNVERLLDPSDGRHSRIKHSAWGEAE